MPQDKDTTGLQTKRYTICEVATPSFGIIFIVMKQRGISDSIRFFSAAAYA
jgi:hypothetical protein